MNFLELPCDIPEVPGLRLRRFAGEADFPRMAPLANACFAADGMNIVRQAEQIRLDYAGFRDWDPARDMVMAEIDGALVGYARTWDWTTGGALVQSQLAFVHPKQRRRGIGGVLLRWLEARQREFAREKAGGMECLHQAFITEGERDRQHLLRKAGYEPVR